MERPHLKYIDAGRVAPTPSISAVTAPGRALGEFGQALEGLGQKGMEIAEQIQNTEDAGKISAWRANADERASKFSDSLLSRQDPGKWGEEWAEMRNAMGAEIGALGLSPRAEERARRDFDSWASDRTAHFSTQAAVRTVSESKARIGNSWSYYAARGDRAGMEATKQEAIASGVFPPSAVTEMEQEGERLATLGEIKRSIQEDPLSTTARIKQAGDALTVEDQERLTRAADIQIQVFQRKGLQEISGKLERREFTTRADLEAALQANPYIEPGLHDEVLFNFDQSQPLDAETRFAITDQLNDLHDDYKTGKLNMDQYRAEHDRLAQLVFTYGTRDGAGALRQRVHALDPAAWNVDNLKEGKSDAVKREISSLGKLYAENGGFGEVDKEAMPSARAGQAHDALDKRGSLEKSVEAWMSDHPNDDVGEVFRKKYLETMAGNIIAPMDDGEVDRMRRWLSSDSTPAAPGDGPPGASNNTPTQPVGGNIMEVVKKFEAGGAPQGFYPAAYWDHGQWSIGYGTKSRQGETITQEEAEKRLTAELSEAREQVVASTGRLGMPLEEHELDALTSFQFNTGRIDQLLAGGSRSKAEIASKMLLYKNASGKPLAGLERRRIAESTLFRRGYATN